jgi:hypothetical protein
MWGGESQSRGCSVVALEMSLGHAFTYVVTMHIADRLHLSTVEVTRLKNGRAAALARCCATPVQWSSCAKA